MNLSHTLLLMKMRDSSDENKLLHRTGLNLPWANVSEHGEVMVEIHIGDLLSSGIFNLTDGFTPGQTSVSNANQQSTTANNFSLSDSALTCS